MNVNKLKELLKERILIDAQNDVLIKENWESQFSILTENLNGTIKFLDSCSKEEFYWVSELFEELSEYFKSKELIDCMERNAKRTGEDCSMDIKYAKDALNY